MVEKKQFQCLRCEHRFTVAYNPKETVERSCPRCGSNSVRPETAAASPAGTASGDGARGGTGTASATGG